MSISPDLVVRLLVILFEGVNNVVKLANENGLDSDALLSRARAQLGKYRADPLWGLDPEPVVKPDPGVDPVVDPDPAEPEPEPEPEPDPEPDPEPEPPTFPYLRVIHYHEILAGREHLGIGDVWWKFVGLDQYWIAPLGNHLKADEVFGAGWYVIWRTGHGAPPAIDPQHPELDPTLDSPPPVEPPPVEPPPGEPPPPVEVEFNQWMTLAVLKIFIPKLQPGDRVYRYQIEVSGSHWESRYWISTKWAHQKPERGTLYWEVGTGVMPSDLEG